MVSHAQGSSAPTQAQLANAAAAAAAARTPSSPEDEDVPVPSLAVEGRFRVILPTVLFVYYFALFLCIVPGVHNF